MKTVCQFAVLCLCGLTACSTTKHPQGDGAKSETETVLITYHVKPGEAEEFRALLERAWKTYRGEHLVLRRPHVVVRDTEETGKPRFVEVFTWVSHAAPERAPDSIKSIWQQEHSLCEERSGHRGIEGGEVELLHPATK